MDIVYNKQRILELLWKAAKEAERKDRRNEKLYGMSFNELKRPIIPFVLLEEQPENPRDIGPTFADFLREFQSDFESKIPLL